MLAREDTIAGAVLSLFYRTSPVERDWRDEEAGEDAPVP
jgi:hypothetical protein